MIFIELYAGLASVSLYLCGHKPPVSRIGSKAGYAEAIVREMGIKAKDIERFVLVDSDPSVVQVLRSLVDPAGRAEIAKILRSHKPSRSLWEHWRGAHFLKHREAARWLLVTAGARGGIGGWKGRHIRRPNVWGFIPEIRSLARRVEALDLDPAKFDIRLGSADVVEPLEFALAVYGRPLVYLDPPYAGRQRYDSTVDTDPIEVAKRWANYGAKVALSESQYGLMTDTWSKTFHEVDLTAQRRGQLRRSMTQSSQEILYVSGRR